VRLANTFIIIYCDIPIYVLLYIIIYCILYRCGVCYHETSAAAEHALRRWAARGGRRCGRVWRHCWRSQLYSPPRDSPKTAFGFQCLSRSAIAELRQVDSSGIHTRAILSSRCFADHGVPLVTIYSVLRRPKASRTVETITRLLFLNRCRCCCCYCCNGSFDFKRGHLGGATEKKMD